MNASRALLAAAALTLALYFVPYGDWLAWPLVLLSTLTHELGHGLTALALGGEFDVLYLWADASGLAAHRGNYSDLSRALVAAGGLLGAPLAALLLFAAGRSAGAARTTLACCAFALLGVAACWVRNAFGLAFVGLLAATLAVIAWKASARAAHIAVVFLAIQLSLSVFSRADYLFTARARTAVGTLPSDTSQMAEALVLPFWFWGGLIALLSVTILWIGLKLYARAVRA